MGQKTCKWGPGSRCSTIGPCSSTLFRTSTTGLIADISKVILEHVKQELWTQISTSISLLGGLSLCSVSITCTLANLLVNISDVNPPPGWNMMGVTWQKGVEALHGMLSQVYMRPGRWPSVGGCGGICFCITTCLGILAGYTSIHTTLRCRSRFTGWCWWFSGATHIYVQLLWIEVYHLTSHFHNWLYQFWR